MNSNSRGVFPRFYAAVLLCVGLSVVAAPLFPQIAAATGREAESRKVATIPVSGMTCGACAEKITRTLNALDGVEKSAVDLGGARAVIHFDPKRVKVRQLVDAIKKAGFKPGKPVVTGV